MKLFTDFFKDEFLALESIKFYDRTLFSNIIDHKYDMTDKQLLEWENKQEIIKEDTKNSFLDDKEEIELVKTYQSDPDSDEGKEAMTKLVENNMPLVYSLVNKFIRSHYQYANNRDDMVQEASLALMRAVELFNSEKSNRFAPYLITCLNGAIKNSINSNRKKSISDLKGDTGLMASLDEKISGQRGEWGDKDMPTAETVPDERNMNSFKKIDKDEMLAEVKDLISTLPEQERIAIKMYYYPDENNETSTLQEIGSKIGMTTMGVKKLIDRVLEKLKNALETSK